MLRWRGLDQSLLSAARVAAITPERARFVSTGELSARCARAGVAPLLEVGLFVARPSPPTLHARTHSPLCRDVLSKGGSPSSERAALREAAAQLWTALRRLPTSFEADVASLSQAGSDCGFRWRHAMFTRCTRKAVMWRSLIALARVIAVRVRTPAPVGTSPLTPRATPGD